jgi:hypothetical protein
MNKGHRRGNFEKWGEWGELIKVGDFVRLWNFRVKQINYYFQHQAAKIWSAGGQEN